MRSLILLMLMLMPGAGTGQAAEPLKVCATTPSLGSLVEEIGGAMVELTVFGKGTEDLHFVEAKPSFLKALNGADALVLNGLDLELGWLPPLVANARNTRVLPGASGYWDASTVVAPLNVPLGTIDRSQGDVHPWGNPHYIVDPVVGLDIARYLTDQLSRQRPADADLFADRFEDFAERLSTRLVGPSLIEEYGWRVGPQLAELHAAGRLADFLAKQQVEVEGWLAHGLTLAGTRVVADHDLWPYFAARFGLRVVGFLEPKPGIPPTTRHLTDMVKVMAEQGVSLVLTAPYFDPRFGEFVAAKTGAQVVALANEVGSRAGAGDYLSMVDYNVAALTAAHQNSSP